MGGRGQANVRLAHAAIAASAYQGRPVEAKFMGHPPGTGGDARRRGRYRYRDRRTLARPQQIAETLPHQHAIARLRRIGRDMEDARIERLHLLRHLVAVEQIEQVARAHRLAFLLQPFGERALFHGPAEARNGNLYRHRELTRPPDLLSPARSPQHPAPSPFRAAGCKARARRRHSNGGWAHRDR